MPRDSKAIKRPTRSGVPEERRHLVPKCGALPRRRYGPALRPLTQTARDIFASDSAAAKQPTRSQQIGLAADKEKELLETWSAEHRTTT